MKTQQTQQPVVHFRKFEFTGDVQAARSFAGAAQKMLDLHIANGNYFPLDDVSYFLQIELEGENFYKKKIIDQTKPIKLENGMTIKHDAMANLIDFPDLSWTWFARNEGLRAILTVGSQLCTIQGDKVFVDNEKVEKWREILTYKAKTKAEEEILEAHINAANAINELNNVLSKNNSRLFPETTLNDLFIFREKIERCGEKTMAYCFDSKKDD